MKSRATLLLAFVCAGMMLSACGASNRSEVGNWWYNQRWEGGSAE